MQLSRTGCSKYPPFRMDAAHLQQVLLNLFKNAEEAAPTGSEISISLLSTAKELRLEIGNYGEPLDTEALEHAFEPFFTTKSKGTGLGHWLVKRVMEEHNGAVMICSDATNGTRITLCFPLTS